MKGRGGNDFYADLQSDIVDEFGGLLGVSPAPVLHHYTTASGLLGIVDSSSLFLSDAEFLNDQSELTYARGIVGDVLRRAAIPDDADIQKMIRAVIDNFEDPHSEALVPVRFYLASFCEDGNLLSQWRAYAASGAGYALGFHGQELANAAWQADTTKGVQLRKVVYNPEEQASIVERIVNLFLARAVRPQYRANGIKPLARMASSFSLVLSAFTPIIKHPLFQEEREWRLIYTVIAGRTPFPIQVRAVGRHLVPYLSIRLLVDKGSRKGKLPLLQIAHGPTLEPAMQKSSIRQLLAACSYSEEAVAVCGSDIPLRVG